MRGCACVCVPACMISPRNNQRRMEPIIYVIGMYHAGGNKVQGGEWTVLILVSFRAALHCNQTLPRPSSSRRHLGFHVSSYLSDLCKTFKRLKTRLQRTQRDLFLLFFLSVLFFFFWRKRNVNLVCALTSER